MNILDWSIITVYLMGMIGLSVFLGRKQSNQEDYYVGGRNLPWWAVGISTMATQTSAISFISVPAFVALAPLGGLTLLQYEMSVPLAMIVVMAFLLPFFRKLELVSVYEYLEMRYGPSVRYLVSTVFLISRALATGVGVYAIAIVLSVCLNTPLWLNILIIGIVTIIYDTIGGMAAVVYSDVIQMVILLNGVVLCIIYAAKSVGGFEVILTSFPAERCKTIDLSTFWGFLIGGFFLYISYYGTDQSQVQRELSAPSADDTRKSLLFNGFARFPLTICYIIMGVAVGAVFAHFPDLRDAVPADHLDYLVPQFILLHIPNRFAWPFSLRQSWLQPCPVWILPSTRFLLRLCVILLSVAVIFPSDVFCFSANLLLFSGDSLLRDLRFWLVIFRARYWKVSTKSGRLFMARFWHHS